jgi:hypothetical protein
VRWGFKPTRLNWQLFSAGGRELPVCPPQLPVAYFFTITHTDMGRSYLPYTLS